MRTDKKSYDSPAMRLIPLRLETGVCSGGVDEGGIEDVGYDDWN